ncbi:MAG: penicillin acylase family protein [Gemmataceae bacterium]
MTLLRTVFRWFLGRRLPTTTGTLKVPALHGRVQIHRDRWGIALVEADDPRDGPFGLGFCHGQDRAFQLEVLLRVARGTLSELFGSLSLPADRLSRRIGFYRAAVEQWPLLDAAIRADIEAYARGVQAGIGLGGTHPAHEFALLGGRPTPWTPLDTLAVTKALSFTLAANWDAELARLKVLSADGPQALLAVDGTYPEWHPAIVPGGQPVGPAADRLAQDLAGFLAWTGSGGGSNCWAVGKERSQTGRPLLANDPHLDASLPAHWYLASLRTPAGGVAGASFVGGPFFLCGHNGTAAWGLTAGLADNTDLFVEELGPDGTSVRQGADFVPCPVVVESISVKGEAAVEERVLITPRGPIISPALTEAPVGLSLRATWLDRVPVVGLFRIHLVKSFAEFRATLAQWPIATQNMVYADVHGSIGWQLIGRIPRRKKGHGTIPQHGADPEAGWYDDPVPFEQHPYVHNPPEGFVVTANNRPTPEGQGPFVGVDFTDGYRAAAITRALAHRHDWTVADTMALQMDRYALAWEEMKEVVLAVPGLDLDTNLALEMLAGWDGRVTGDSVPASVYELFLVEMILRIARARAPKSWQWVVGAGLSPLTPYNFTAFRRTGHLVRLLREQPDGWFDHPWPEVVASALGEAVRKLNTVRGVQTGTWTWGAVRPQLFWHPLTRKPGPLGRALGAIFNLGPIPGGGDADVINQAAVLPLHPLTPSNNIPSLRAVFDVGAWHQSRFILPGGQSGNPLSPHYGDMLPLWQRGEGVPIAFTPDEVHQAAVKTLELAPA